jgi:two-component system phosphate regulon sensor histidine kinase PhoR
LEVAKKKGVALSSELPTASVYAWGNEESLCLIFNNLLHNAVNHTPAGGRVDVSAVAVAGVIHVVVLDTGIGIAAEQLERIFERFYRADKARSREQGGTGLGLSIVKHVVQAHGGEVRVESKLGSGSTFFFTLATAKA